MLSTSEKLGLTALSKWLIIGVGVFVLFAWRTYSNDSAIHAETVDAGNDVNFTIAPNTNADLPDFNRRVGVFGVWIYAVSGVDDSRLLHAANVMAQYLDNDEDGVVDNPLVLREMLAAGAFMVMWKRESDLNNINVSDNTTGQDLGNGETRPEWHRNNTGAFDAALEEVWHIITHAGYANAYPDVFGERADSTIADAMDVARGGRFLTIPRRYPAGAWYRYDDRSCDYGCMVTEYFYWTMTSLMGAQQNRLDEIEHEWSLNTRSKVQTTDTSAFSLLTNPKYRLPRVLPDGSYLHPALQGYAEQKQQHNRLPHPTFPSRGGVAGKA